jgi:hypothetical protein
MNKHHLPYHLSNLQLWLAPLAIAVTVAAPGCGGNDPLQPAHSGSFFPVRGTTEMGADTVIKWTYRINGGQPVALAADPGISIRFSDETVTAQGGSTITTSLSGTVIATGVSGGESVTETDHLTSDSPATVSERDADTRLSLSEGGTSLSETEMLRYAFGTTPLPTFFDRDDLDTLALGFSESHESTAAVTGTITASGTGVPAQSQTVTTSITDSQSWTLADKLATFDVLGTTYMNVVKVQRTTTVTDASTGTPQQGTGTLWLAKGIGLIREEDSASSVTGTDTLVSELVSTNLVGP